MKMLAKAGAYFLPIAMPLVCKYVLLLNWKLLWTNVSSSRVRINLPGLFFVVEQRERAPVAQWVVHLTHTQLVPGSKYDWCKNPLVFAMIASWL